MSESLGLQGRHQTDLEWSALCEEGNKRGQIVEYIVYY
jgi:hypothetical protein